MQLFLLDHLDTLGHLVFENSCHEYRWRQIHGRLRASHTFDYNKLISTFSFKESFNLKNAAVFVLNDQRVWFVRCKCDLITISFILTEHQISFFSLSLLTIFPILPFFFIYPQSDQFIYLFKISIYFYLYLLKTIIFWEIEMTVLN